MKWAPGNPTHTCAAVACQAQVPLHLLMCVDHWRMVPAALRREVWARYRRVALEPGARAGYQVAVQAAVDAVHTKQLARKASNESRTRPLF